MERQTLLVGLVLITLIVNVVLGIELYYALHRQSQPIGQVPINISGLQIVSSSNVSTSSMTKPVKTNVTYSFSFQVKFKIHVKDRGIYIVGIKPDKTFAQLYVLLYLENGQVVSLNLNHTSANVTIKDKDVTVVAYISGSSYENLSPQQIFNDIGLYLKFISPLNDNEENNDLILTYSFKISQIIL
ncbi:MAG: hypothetical protein QXY60_06070 [Saccharolobus sp.]